MTIGRPLTITGPIAVSATRVGGIAALARILGCSERALRYWATGEKPTPKHILLALRAVRKSRETDSK